MSNNNEQESYESPEALHVQLNKTEDYVKKNKTIFIAAIGAVVLLVFGVWFWKSNSTKSEIEAAKAIYVAEDYFRKDSLDLALNGDGMNKGFLAVSSSFSGTKAGALADFYIGVIEINKGNFEEAAKRLSKYDTDAYLVQARAYVLAGDAYSEQGNTAEAIKYYTKASDSQPNEEFTPGYLMKLALAYENDKKFADAVLTYEKIASDYPNCKQIDNVRKYLAKTTLLAKKD